MWLESVPRALNQSYDEVQMSGGTETRSSRVLRAWIDAPDHVNFRQAKGIVRVETSLTDVITLIGEGRSRGCHEEVPDDDALPS